MAEQPVGVTVLEHESLEEAREISGEEVREYAEFLGIDPIAEPHLMWIAEEGVVMPVPHPWKACTQNNDDVFYFNFETGESVWDHPCDSKYRALVESERARIEAGGDPADRPRRGGAEEDDVSSEASPRSPAGGGADAPQEQSAGEEYSSDNIKEELEDDDGRGSEGESSQGSKLSPGKRDEHPRHQQEEADEADESIDSAAYDKESVASSLRPSPKAGALGRLARPDGEAASPDEEASLDASLDVSGSGGDAAAGAASGGRLGVAATGDAGAVAGGPRKHSTSGVMSKLRALSEEEALNRRDGATEGASRGADGAERQQPKEEPAVAQPSKAGEPLGDRWHTLEVEVASLTRALSMLKDIREMQQEYITLLRTTT